MVLEWDGVIALTYTGSVSTFLNRFNFKKHSKGKILQSEILIFIM